MSDYSFDHAAAGLPKPALDFPVPVDSYHDQQIPSLFGKLTGRIQREPLNLVATIIFFGAIVHTFLAGGSARLRITISRATTRSSICSKQKTAHRISGRDTTSCSSGLSFFISWAKSKRCSVSG